jgi:predicted amidohydrolase YtcJ
VDAIYYNGNIITVDSLFSKAEAFAVKDGKFIAVGNYLDILKKYDSKNRIDLHKKFVYPGLIDAHCHFVSYAYDLSKCHLVGTKSFHDVLEKVVAYSREQNPQFIFGRGWDQNDWETKEFPNNEKLNEWFSDKPVFLERVDGHAVLVNDVFLKMADSILRPYKNTPYIEMKNGRPTGILLDNAMDAAERLIPAASVNVQRNDVILAQEDCFKLGLTTVCDAGLGPRQISFIDSLQKLNILKIRVYAMVSASNENLKYLEKNGKIKTPYLNVQSLKVYADGALGSRGAKLKKDYSDKPHHTGSLNISLKDLEKYASWAMQHGFQLNAHAIGDSGNAFILNVYAKYLMGKNDLRWRIEHAQVVDLSDMHMFGDYSIIPSVQPTHATSDMYWAKDRLGKKRMGGAYAYKSLLKENGWLPLGTDFPVEHLNPQYTFYAAVSRRDAESFPKDGFQMEEALTREEALRGITIWAAKANFEEHEKGSIEPGKYADFIICDEDYLNDDLLKIRNSAPLQTFVNGQLVYTKN